MKSNSRRTFIKLASTATLGYITMPEITSAQSHELIFLRNEENPDEAYWKMVRKQFPLTDKLVYLNNGTMGPSPYPVIERMQAGMMDADVDVNYGGWENTCKPLAAFLGVTADELVLTRNVTEGINIICNGLTLKKGDEVIITTHEHGGNAFPWLNMAKQKGVVLKPINPAPTAMETLANIQKAISGKTKVIAVPHILCTQGQILPVKEISKLGKERGIFVFIDGAHGPGMLPLNIADIGCDAYASCCHKWMLGPKGTGFLYVKKDAMEKITPWFVGAGSDNAKWNMATQPPTMGDYAANAHRYYAGTYNAGLYKGVVAAIDFIQTIGIENIHKRITTLAAYMQQQLLSLGDRIEMLTPTEEISRGAVIGFRVKGIESIKLSEWVSAEKIRIRMVHENGLNSLRVSTHIYNSYAEIDQFVQVIKSRL